MLREYKPPDIIKTKAKPKTEICKNGDKATINPDQNISNQVDIAK